MLNLFLRFCLRNLPTRTCPCLQSSSKLSTKNLPPDITPHGNKPLSAVGGKNQYENDRSSNGNSKKMNDKDHLLKPPEEDECCGTGCDNCVWIVYAQSLIEQLNCREAGLKEVRRILNEQLGDSEHRSFVQMELKMRGFDIS